LRLFRHRGPRANRATYRGSSVKTDLKHLLVVGAALVDEHGRFRRRRSTLDNGSAATQQRGSRGA